MTSFTIGTDPEFFLQREGDNKLISAIPFVEGTKHEPQMLKCGGNIQRDNVAVEFATKPATSSDEFVKTIGETLGDVIDKLPKDTRLMAIPSACFELDQLDHPEALAFGCDPDYDAWDLVQNEPPCANDQTFRSCGAHIHLGSTGEDENAFLLDPYGKINTIKIMDCILGVISVVLDSSEEAIARRQLYGKPGAHRPKEEYGVEYRVLSNFWLRSPVTVMMIYHLSKDVLDLVRENKVDEIVNEMGEHEVKNTIMEGNVNAAMKMIETSVIPRLSKESIHYFNEALAKVKANDMDFHAEWGLYGKEKVV